MSVGKVFKFHNDLDTDQIIASQYLLLPTIEEMKVHTFESLDPGISAEGKAWRLCGRRREFWLRFFQRAGAQRIEGIGRTGSGCQIICPYFLPKRHQYRPSCDRV